MLRGARRRQSEDETHSPLGEVLADKIPAEQSRVIPGYRQPETAAPRKGPAGVRFIEALEDLRKVVRGDSGTLIRHRDLDKGRPGRPGARGG